MTAGEGLIVTEPPTQGNETIAVGQLGITNDLIADSAVTNNKLATGSVDSRAILDGSILGINIAENTITGSNIANNTILGSNIHVPLQLTRSTPGDVLDVSNTSNLSGGPSAVNILGHSSLSSSPVVLIGPDASAPANAQGVVGGPMVLVTNQVGQAIQGQTGASNFNAVEGDVTSATAVDAAGVSGFANMGGTVTQWGVEGVNKRNG